MNDGMLVICGSSLWPFKIKHIYEYHIDRCNQQCLSDQPSVLFAKSINIGHYCYTRQANSFMPAMLMSAINFYYFIPHSVALSSALGTRSAQSRICALNFLVHFSTFQDEIWCWDVAVQIESLESEVYVMRWKQLLFY